MVDYIRDVSEMRLNYGWNTFMGMASKMLLVAQENSRKLLVMFYQFHV